MRFSFAVLLSVAGAAWMATPRASAQPPSPPQLQACSNLHVGGKAAGTWEGQRDTHHSGQFQLTIDLGCSGDTPGVEVRNLELQARDLAGSDPGIERVISADGIVQLASAGPAMTPAVFITGSCQGGGSTGCRFWLMLVDNDAGQAKAQDFAAFLVTDGTGARLAYGAGPIDEGDISITGAR
jgi:hypothetical protein